MLLAMAACVALVITTILILYELLRLTSSHLAELPIPPRARIIIVVLAIFAGHTMAVWVYAFAYWVLATQLELGSFTGLPVQTFQDCLYFSVVTYTTLGFGDQVPVSHARLIAGVEALNGLMLISWSASFTYLAMERYWPLHGQATRSRQTIDRRGGGRVPRSPPANATDAPDLRAARPPRLTPERDASQP